MFTILFETGGVILHVCSLTLFLCFVLLYKLRADATSKHPVGHEIQPLNFEDCIRIWFLWEHLGFIYKCALNFVLFLNSEKKEALTEISVKGPSG